MTRTKEQILADMAPLRSELWEAERVARHGAGADLVGRCFKYHNSYSGGERWWYYVKVTRLQDDGHLRSFAFQSDIRDKIEIETDRYVMVETFDEGGGYLPISAQEFEQAWQQLRRKIESLGPPKGSGKPKSRRARRTK